MKLGFLFGAGAEVGYGLPSGNLPLIFLDMTPVKVKKHLKR